MSDTSLIFNLLAIDRVTSVLAGVGSGFDRLAIGIGLAAADAAGHMVSMAGDFQQAITRLQTGAGESADNLATVSNGILDMAGQVGESTKDLAAGMYLISSAGFHGADGLNVLRDAAEGARVGNADLATVANAVTTGLNAYHLSADHATEVTNALIAAEGQGKTTLEDLAGSLSTVAPAASIAGISLNETLAAMSTMTAMGTSSANAATYLRQTILQLSNPTAKARAEMQSLGLSSIEVSQNLGTNGLASTLTMLTDAIQAHMGPAGTVLIQQLKGAAGNADTFQQILANLPPTQQTFIGALADMVGGTKSMQAALELTGQSMPVFENNLNIINGKVKDGGDGIEGWSTVQKNFNTQLAEAKGQMEAVGIKIGTILLPKAIELTHWVSEAVGWFTKHKDVAKDLADVIGILAGAFLLYKTGLLAYKATMAVVEIATKAWTAAQWLLNVAMDANPIGLIIIAIAALAVGIWYLWNHSEGFRKFFIGAWNDIWGFLKTIGAWFAGPFASFFVQLGHDIAAPFLWLWHNVIEPAFHTIAAIIQGDIRIATSAFNLAAFIFRETVGKAVLWLWHEVVEPAFHGIAAVATWLWENAIRPVIDFVVGYFKVMAAAGMWLWHEAIEPALHGIGAAASWVYDNLLHPAFEAIVGAVKWVGDTFSNIFSAIGGYVSAGFNGAVDLIRGVLNGIIDVINDATGGVNKLIDTVNKVPGVNFPHIPAIPHLAEGGTATRGGYALVGEQGAEVVRLGAGDTVYPHGTGPGGGQPIDLRVTIDVPEGPEYDLERALAHRLRKFVRVNAGGNVQLAFGTIRR